MRAMSNRHVIVRMFDEVINKGDIDLVDELFHPEFQTETPQGPFDLEGFKQYVIGWRAGFPDLHAEVGDFVEEGDKIAWSVRATGTQTGDFMGIPATGRSVDFDSLNVGEFRDGRAYRHKVVMDTMRMMVQLGLAPDPTAG